METIVTNKCVRLNVGHIATCLVTGSTGLLGGHVLFALLQKHERVAALRRPSSKTDTLREIFSFYTKEMDQLLERIDWRTGDILDKESLLQALDGISCVINCAAVVSFNPGDRNRMITNNVTGVRNLAEALREKEKERRKDGDDSNLDELNISMIHISSIAALGDGPGDDPKYFIDENTLRDPNRRHSGYSESKFKSEQVLSEMGIKAVVLNPGVILGPGQWVKGSSQLFVKVWEGLKYYPYGGTGYIDVRDIGDIVCEISARLSVASCRESQSPVNASLPLLMNQRFCLVGANLRYREFFNLLTDEYGKPNPPIYAGKFMTAIAWRADRIRSGVAGREPVLTRETAEASQRISYYSSEKIKKAINFDFRPVEETIEWVAGFYLKTLDR